VIEGNCHAILGEFFDCISLDEIQLGKPTSRQDDKVPYDGAKQVDLSFQQKTSGKNTTES
jgi:hypothetical protein